MRLFFSGKKVEINRINDPRFNVKEQAEKLLQSGAQFFACGACLKSRDSGGSEICPLSTMKDQYEIIRDSDNVIMV